MLVKSLALCAQIWAKIPTISSHDTMSAAAAADTFHVHHTSLMIDDMVCNHVLAAQLCLRDREEKNIGKHN
jgi:hypothetical protein